MPIPTRINLGKLDLISGIIFLIGLSIIQSNTNWGLIIMGIAVLKQFSGR